jgi:hypothetical protein
MSVLVCHITGDAAMAAWLSANLEADGHRVELRNIDREVEERAELPNKYYNEIDIVLLLLSREALPLPQVEAEIETCLALLRSRSTFQLIPVLAVGEAWPRKYVELKYVPLQVDLGKTAAEIREAIDRPHFKPAHDCVDFSVAYSRLGAPFGQEKSVTVANGFGVSDYLIFTLIHADGPEAKAEALAVLAQYHLLGAVREDFLSGRGIEDAARIALTLDQYVKSMQQDAPPDLLCGLRLGVMIVSRGHLALFNFGRIGGFVLQPTNAFTPDRAFFARPLDSKGQLRIDASRNANLAYRAPIGHLLEILFIEPRIVDFKEAGAFVCLSNAVLSDLECRDLVADVIVSRGMEQAGARIAGYTARSERKKGYDGARLLSVLFSTPGLLSSDEDGSGADR